MLVASVVEQLRQPPPLRPVRTARRQLSEGDLRNRSETSTGHRDRCQTRRPSRTWTLFTPRVWEQRCQRAKSLRPPTTNSHPRNSPRDLQPAPTDHHGVVCDGCRCGRRCSRRCRSRAGRPADPAHPTGCEQTVRRQGRAHHRRNVGHRPSSRDPVRPRGWEGRLLRPT
jgi:hypothetical protein